MRELVDPQSCRTLVSSQERYWSRRSPLSPPAERAATASPRTAWTAGRWVLTNWCHRHNQAVKTVEDSKTQLAVS